MTKRTIKVNIQSYIDLEGNVEDVIKRLQAKLDEHPGKVLHLVDTGYEYTEYGLAIERQETDQEYAIRIEKEKTQLKSRLEAARKTYEQLSKELGEEL